ncbi:Protein of unknown function [Bacillus mycoides]|nr:Protein of unknown function [Bacillus mycoides]
MFIQHTNNMIDLIFPDT